jgi:hypothetical protein
MAAIDDDVVDVLVLELVLVVELLSLERSVIEFRVLLR